MACVGDCMFCAEHMWRCMHAHMGNAGKFVAATCAHNKNLPRVKVTFPRRGSVHTKNMPCTQVETGDECASAGQVINT